MKTMSQTIVTFLEETTPLLSPSTLIFLVLVPLIFLLVPKHASKSPPLPPGPFAWPIVGNMFQIGSNPHETLARLAQTYGPLFSFKLGPKLVVVGSSPQAAMEILKTHDRILSARFVPHVAPAKCMELHNFSVGWVSECDDSWKYLRTFCRTELFSGKSINSQAWIRDQKVKEMLGFVGKMEGKAVKIRDLSFAALLNMLSNILVSKDLTHLENESLNGGICGLMRSMTDVASCPNISDLYPILAPYDLQNLQKKARELCNGACEMWESIMEEKKVTKSDDDSGPPDFLDALINNGFSSDQINVLFVV